MFDRRDMLKVSALASVGFGGVSSLQAKEISNAVGLVKIDEVVMQRGRVRCQVKFSYGTEDYFYFVLIRIRSGSFVGLGEGIMKDFNGVKPIAEKLVGKDALELDNLIPNKGWNNPREAMSMALHDLVAKKLGVPLHVLLGGAARKTVPLMPCIFPKDPADAQTKAAKFAAMGFKSAKFKMVGIADEDLANLKAVRRGMPVDALVLADANKGYKDYDELIKLLPEFDKAGLTIFEDPLDGDFDQYKSLMGKTRIKIMMDVFARSEAAYRTILEKKCCDIVNQHPNHQGGMSYAIMRANACQIMGMPTWAGGTGFLGVGSAGYQHLASVIGLSMPCGELGGKYDHGFADDIVVNPLSLKDGAVQLLDVPGLGVEIDEKSLSKLMLEEIRVA